MDVDPTTPTRDENGKHRPALSPTAAVFNPKCNVAIAPRLLAFIPGGNGANESMSNDKVLPVSLLEAGKSKSISHDIEMEEKDSTPVVHNLTDDHIDLVTDVDTKKKDCQAEKLLVE